MPRHCSICSRSDRELVDAAMAAGDSFREVARRFGLALGTVHRHKKHVRHAPVDAIAERSEAERSPEPVPNDSPNSRAVNRGPDWIPDPDDYSPLAHSQRRLLEARRRAGRWV
jgi:hypothetical protein